MAAGRAYRGVMDASRLPLRLGTVALGAVLVVGLTACGSAPVPSPSASQAPVSIASLFPVDPSALPSLTIAPSDAPAEPLGATGSVVVLGNDLSMSLVGPDGRTQELASAADGTFAFPAWSPDGDRIAAIRYGPTERTILIYGIDPQDATPTGEPVIILQSAEVGAFYLSWSPDGRSVSYLASEADRLSLRVAPSDGSAPIDGSGEGSVVGSGSPFYFDWIGSDRLLAHVGTGPSALLAEIGLDGSAEDPVLGSPGEFRSAVVSPDRSLVSFVRVDDAGTAEVVVAARDGTDPQSVPVFGPAAMTFDPTGADVATIGAAEPLTTPLTVPVGPLRLLERESGTARTLLDEIVLAFWWSPDGESIAALTARPSDAASQVHLVFVDVPTGEIRSETQVTLGRLFIDQVLGFFDQYALSHRLWSSDSRAFLLPIVDADGRTLVGVMARDGGDPVFLSGQAAFWSP
jgi:TolB protein